jgi:hypothetical protein
VTFVAKKQFRIKLAACLCNSFINKTEKMANKFVSVRYTPDGRCIPPIRILHITHGFHGV